MKQTADQIYKRVHFLTEIRFTDHPTTPAKFRNRLLRASTEASVRRRTGSTGFKGLRRLRTIQTTEKKQRKKTKSFDMRTTSYTNSPAIATRGVHSQPSEHQMRAVCQLNSCQLRQLKFRQKMASRRYRTEKKKQFSLMMKEDPNGRFEKTANVLDNFLTENESNFDAFYGGKGRLLRAFSSTQRGAHKVSGFRTGPSNGFYTRNGQKNLREAVTPKRLDRDFEAAQDKLYRSQYVEKSPGILVEENKKLNFSTSKKGQFQTPQTSRRAQKSPPIHPTTSQDTPNTSKDPSKPKEEEFIMSSLRRQYSQRLMLKNHTLTNTTQQPYFTPLFSSRMNTNLTIDQKNFNKKMTRFQKNFSKISKNIKKFRREVQAEITSSTSDTNLKEEALITKPRESVRLKYYKKLVKDADLASQLYEEERHKRYFVVKKLGDIGIYQKVREPIDMRQFEGEDNIQYFNRIRKMMNEKFQTKSKILDTENMYMNIRMNQKKESMMQGYQKIEKMRKSGSAKNRTKIAKNGVFGGGEASSDASGPAEGLQRVDSAEIERLKKKKNLIRKVQQVAAILGASRSPGMRRRRPTEKDPNFFRNMSESKKSKNGIFRESSSVEIIKDTTPHPGIGVDINKFQCGSSIGFINYKIPYHNYGAISHFLRDKSPKIASIILELCFNAKENTFWKKIEDLKFPALKLLSIKNHTLQPSFLTFLENHVYNLLSIGTIMLSFIRVSSNKQLKVLTKILRTKHLKVKTLVLDNCIFFQKNTEFLGGLIPALVPFLENLTIADFSFSWEDNGFFSGYWMFRDLNYLMFEKVMFGVGGKLEESVFGMGGFGGLFHELDGQIVDGGGLRRPKKLTGERKLSSRKRFESGDYSSYRMSKNGVSVNVESIGLAGEPGKRKTGRRTKKKEKTELGATLRFFGLRRCELRVRSLEWMLRGFFVNKMGYGAYGGFWDQEGDLNNVIDTEEAERRKRRFNGVRSFDLSKNLFDLSEFMKSEFGSKVDRIPTLSSFAPEMRFILNRWDDSLYAAHYLPRLKYTEFTEKMKFIVLELTQDDYSELNIVLYHEYEDSLINPGGISVYPQCPNLNRWKYTTIYFECPKKSEPIFLKTAFYKDYFFQMTYDYRAMLYHTKVRLPPGNHSYRIVKLLPTTPQKDSNEHFFDFYIKSAQSKQIFVSPETNDYKLELSRDKSSAVIDQFVIKREQMVRKQMVGMIKDKLGLAAALYRRFYWKTLNRVSDEAMHSDLNFMFARIKPSRLGLTRGQLDGIFEFLSSTNLQYFCSFLSFCCKFVRFMGFDGFEGMHYKERMKKRRRAVKRKIMKALDPAYSPSEGTLSNISKVEVNEDENWSLLKFMEGNGAMTAENLLSYLKQINFLTSEYEINLMIRILEELVKSRIEDPDRVENFEILNNQKSPSSHTDSKLSKERKKRASILFKTNISGITDKLRSNFMQSSGFSGFQGGESSRKLRKVVSDEERKKRRREEEVLGLRPKRLNRLKKDQILVAFLSFGFKMYNDNPLNAVESLLKSKINNKRVRQWHLTEAYIRKELLSDKAIERVCWKNLSELKAIFMSFTGDNKEVEINLLLEAVSGKFSQNHISINDDIIRLQAIMAAVEDVEDGKLQMDDSDIDLYLSLTPKIRFEGFVEFLIRISVLEIDGIDHDMEETYLVDERGSVKYWIEEVCRNLGVIIEVMYKDALERLRSRGLEARYKKVFVKHLSRNDVDDGLARIIKTDY